MEKSIFELENRLDIQKEFGKLVNELHTKAYCHVPGNFVPFIKLVNGLYFKKWKFRDTFLSVDEYLEFLGITYSNLKQTMGIDKEFFLRYLEFILNMYRLVIDLKGKEYLGQEIFPVMDNISIILEKMNYKSNELEDRIIISKRDIDVDSIIRLIPSNLIDYVLEYNDFRNESDINAKRTILKNMDLYIEDNKAKITQIVDNKIYSIIGEIGNKMGINHPISEEPYIHLDDKKLIHWYDKCFLLMLHCIRMIEIDKIKKEFEEMKKDC